MNIIERAKNVLVAPKKEWPAIDGEGYAWSKVLMSYLLPLALIPTVGAFIGYGLVGHTVMGMKVGGVVSWGVRQGIMSLISILGGAYITALVINLLAENFKSAKNFDRAFSLVAYSYTPMCVAGVLYILPALAPLAMLAGLYGLYILYTGLQPMMGTPTEKVTTYFVVSLICMIAVSLILGAVLGAIIVGSSPALRF